MIENEDVPLSFALRDEKKAQFISKDKISLSYCNISSIDRMPYPFNKVTKLHISHNKLVSLDGIEQFQNLEQLSLSHNRIEDLNEFFKVNNRHRIKKLSVRGNPLISHPDYLNRLVEIFSGASRIDELRIEPGDRKLLIDYERISGLVIPFYISLQRDIEVATSCLDRINEIQRVKSQTDDNMIQNSARRENLASIDSDGIKIMNELRTNLSHPDLLSGLNLKQKTNIDSVTRISLDRGPLFVLGNIVSLIIGLYPKFDHIGEEDSNVLYEAYRTIFNEIMIQYHGQQDNSFDTFLTHQVLQNRSYDLERFSNDSAYAFECILLEFYKLMPSQAFFTENIINDSKSTDKAKPDPKKDKEESTKISPLDITTTDPDYLKTIWLAHFPIFPLNRQYLSNLYTVLRTHVHFLESTCSEFFETFESVYNLQNNERDSMTLGSLRVHPRPGEGFSTRESGGFVEQVEEEDQRFRGPKRGSTQIIGELPEEKSVLPLLLFVKLSDKTNADKTDFLNLLKQILKPSQIVGYKKQTVRQQQSAPVKEVQDLVLDQEQETKKKYFNTLEEKLSLKKADLFYHKNLCLKVLYSLLKSIAQKRGILGKVLTELDGRLYYEKKKHFTKWKLFAKALSRTKARENYKLGDRTVKFEDGDNTMGQGTGFCSHSFGEGSRSSRSNRKAFESWESHEPGHYSHRNIFRKCAACDSFPDFKEKL